MASSLSNVKDEPHEVSTQGGKTCPKCGAQNQSAAKFCSECGTALPQTKFCPECGQKLEEGTKFCPNCGHKII